MLSINLQTFPLPAPPSPPTPYHHRHCDPFCCLFAVPDLPKPRKSIPKLSQKSTRNPPRENIEIQTSKKLEKHGQLYIGNMKVVGFPSVKLTIRKNSSNANKLENEVKSCSLIYFPKINKKSMKTRIENRIEIKHAKKTSMNPF